MTKDQIPQFIEDLIAVGAPVCAVGRECYVIGDADLPEDEQPAVWEVCNHYEPRDHLLHEIVAHLRSIGRFLDIERERLQ